MFYTGFEQHLLVLLLQVDLHRLIRTHIAKSTRTNNYQVLGWFGEEMANKTNNSARQIVVIYYTVEKPCRMAEERSLVDLKLSCLV